MGWGRLGELVEQPGEPFFISPEIRRQHLYALGRTGSGKSTLLARLALQDIKRRDGLLVLDPHGDLVEDIIDHCPDDQRDRVIYLDPSDREHPVPLNLFECKPGQDRDTITSEVIGVFKRFYGDMWGPLLEDLLRSLTLTMLDHQFLNDARVPVGHQYNATLKEAHDFLFNQDMRTSYYPFISNPMVKGYWEDFYDHLGSTKGGLPVTQQQVRHSSSTTNKLRRFLLNPLMFDIVANRDFMNTIDLRELMDERKVLLVNLSKGRLGEDNSSLLGSVLLSRLVVAALSRSDISRQEREETIFHVIADEFQAFATDSFKLLLSEARKYGVTLTIAHQHRDQLDLEMKGAALNCGSLVCFRLLGRDAADVGREFDATPTNGEDRYERVRVPVGVLPLKHVAPEGAHLRERLDKAEADVETLEGVIHGKTKELRTQESRLRAFESGNTNSHDLRVLEEPAGYDRYRTFTRPQVEKDIERLKQQRVEDAAALTEARARLDLARAALEQPDSPFLEWRDDDEWDSENERWMPRYKRLLSIGSYAERERAIANELTQLPNFRAKVRLADGSHTDVHTLPLPAETAERFNKIENRRQETRKTFAVPKERRRSIGEADYFSALRRQEAAEYEAEMDEQPEPSPLASSTP